jgi:hypothetical protein
MVFKATFNNISVISWWSVLLESSQLQIVFNVTDTPVTGTAYPSGEPEFTPGF